MLIRLTANYSSPEFGLINAGLILHFPNAIAIKLLNAGAAEVIKSDIKKETALRA